MSSSRAQTWPGVGNVNAAFRMKADDMNVYSTDTSVFYVPSLRIPPARNFKLSIIRDTRVIAEIRMAKFLSGARRVCYVSPYTLRHSALSEQKCVRRRLVA
jgi:hypothetical protein